MPSSETFICAICEANEVNCGATEAGMLKLKQNDGPPRPPDGADSLLVLAVGAAAAPEAPSAGRKLKLKVKLAPFPALKDLLDVFFPPSPCAPSPGGLAPNMMARERRVREGMGKQSVY